MLAADKLLLHANIKQSAVQLKEKELSLHHENFTAVGTQAAVLAGFALTALAEVDVPPSCDGVRRAAWRQAMKWGNTAAPTALPGGVGLPDHGPAPSDLDQMLP